jgi:hypothetical protein
LLDELKAITHPEEEAEICFHGPVTDDQSHRAYVARTQYKDPKWRNLWLVDGSGDSENEALGDLLSTMVDVIKEFRKPKKPDMAKEQQAEE